MKQNLQLETFEVTTKTGEVKKCVALVRKLTERECFRLMGVDDEDIDKLSSCGISRSAQYRLAGNSIVVDVLEQIYYKMFINRGGGKKSS